jgi:signal transduction histidine kinase
VKPTVAEPKAPEPSDARPPSPRSASALGRASLLRHLAISGAALAAYAMRRELHVGGSVLWILGLTAVANMALARLADLPALSEKARRISPVLGVTAWAALVHMTGGAASPLVAGFWLEIVFSALVFPPAGTLLVTSGVAASLWAQQAIAGIGSSLGHLGLQTGFVAAIGLLTFFASRRWQREHQTLQVEAGALSRRLRDLEGELEATRTLGQVGERVAGLAHSLKNTVHSLRGFTKLVEPSSLGTPVQKQTLEGLRLAIDRLEETARATLRPSESDGHATRTTTTGSDVRRPLGEVVAEMTRTHATVRWVTRESEGLPGVALSSARLREVLLILAQNAAEASGDSGEVTLRADVDGDVLRLVVQDQGPGLDPQLRERLFRPGATTKAEGSGFGLFLARRLVESGGGQLTVAQAAQGGALVSVRLPVLPS